MFWSTTRPPCRRPATISLPISMAAGRRLLGYIIVTRDLALSGAAYLEDRKSQIGYARYGAH